MCRPEKGTAVPLKPKTAVPCKISVQLVSTRGR